MYWKTEHQRALEQYYYCQSATTSAITRQYLFNHILYPPLKNLAETALKHYHNQYLCNDDNVQESLIFIYQLLTKLNKDKLQGAFNWIWISTKRNIVNIIRKAEQTPRIESLNEVNKQLLNVNDNSLKNNYNQEYVTDIINSESNYNLIDYSTLADKAFTDQDIKDNIINELNKMKTNMKQ